LQPSARSAALSFSGDLPPSHGGQLSHVGAERDRCRFDGGLGVHRLYAALQPLLLKGPFIATHSRISRSAPIQWMAMKNIKQIKHFK
jgi:hypothetical protein